MRKRLPFHEICDIACFCLRLFEEPRAHRNVVEKIPDDHTGTVGSSDLLKIELDPVILRKPAQELICGSYARKGVPGFRDHLHLGYCGDA